MNSEYRQGDRFFRETLRDEDFEIEKQQIIVGASHITIYVCVCVRDKRFKTKTDFSERILVWSLALGTVENGETKFVYFLLVLVATDRYRAASYYSMVFQCIIWQAQYFHSS